MLGDGRAALFELAEAILAASAISTWAEVAYAPLMQPRGPSLYEALRDGRSNRYASLRIALRHGRACGVSRPEMVEPVLQIRIEFKRRDGVEWWILRRALDGALPESVLTRTKAKSREGAGVGDLLAQHVEERITDGDFAAKRILPNGWSLNTKEELLYYRIFREHFGELA